MSVSNLFQKNNYDIYANDVTANEIIVDTLDVDNLTVQQLTIDNGAQSVDLTVNNNNALVISGGDIFAEGIQFSVDQSIFNKYNYSVTDYTIPLDYLGSQVGELFCQFEKIGGTIFCQVRGFIVFPIGAAVATVALDPLFRPVHETTILIPFYRLGAAPDAVMAFGILDINGIISIYTTIPAPNGGGTYNTGIQTGPSNYDRYTFCYRA